MTTWWLRGVTAVLPDRTLEGATLRLEGDRIAAIGRDEPTAPDAACVEGRGLLLVPGLIDTHVHGGLHHDTMDADPEALAAIARHLAGHGVTSWLPTTVACAPDRLDAVLGAIAAAQGQPHDGAEILGAHLESNFLSPRFKGAQPAAWLRACDDPQLLEVLARHAPTLRLVTLAPELPGALELIAWLVRRGVGVSVGHTDATYDEVRQAIAAGATRVTHLCNAQRGFHHREPGTLGAGLSCDELSAEIIADGVHVHPAGLAIAYRCKGPDRLVLVSDALRGAGLPPGTYELGGQATHLDGRVARLEDGTIAGSVTTLERCLATMVRDVGVPMIEAVRMAATTPARTLGLAAKGRLEVGGDADMVLLTADLEVRATWVKGRQVHGDPLGPQEKRPR